MGKKNGTPREYSYVCVDKEAIKQLRIAMIRKGGTTRGICGVVSDAVLVKAKELSS